MCSDDLDLDGASPAASRAANPRPFVASPWSSRHRKEARRHRPSHLRLGDDWGFIIELEAATLAAMSMNARIAPSEGRLEGAIVELRDEMKAGDGRLRDVMKASEGRLRDEMKASAGRLEGAIVELRDEMKAIEGRLRDEMKASAGRLEEAIVELRDEMKAGDGQLRDAMKASEGRLEGAIVELRDEMRAVEGRLRDEMKASAGRLVNVGDRLSKVEGVMEGMFWSARNQPSEAPREGAA